MVKKLPAVLDVTREGGLFDRVTERNDVGDVNAARRILEDGIFDMHKVEFLTRIRDMSPFEYRAVEEARQTIQFGSEVVWNFDSIFVLNTNEPYVLSFGPYMVIDQETLRGKHIKKIMAHELAHLNNGDSYVRAAFWFLGKGWFQEWMGPFGVKASNREQEISDFDRRVSGATKAVLDTIRYGWTGGAVSVGGMILSEIAGDKGKGVQAFGKEITDYFHRWDIEADAVAERMVGVIEYQSYLRALTKGDYARPFDASAYVRLEESEVRHYSVPPFEGYTRVTPMTTSVPSKPTFLQKAVQFVMVASLIIVMLGLCLIWSTMP